MLPKEHRLTRTQDYARVRRYGRSSGSPLMVIYVLPRNSAEVRVGFSVSKRVGKATVRNRAKRRMREAVRAQLRCIAGGADIVLIARPASATATYDQITETVGYLLRKTGTTREVPPRAIHA